MQADEHWIVTNIKGYGAYSPSFKYEPDKLHLQKMVIVFTENGGTVSGSDSKFMKIDDSTLIGQGWNDRGTSLIEVYQINRKHKKLHLTITRVGSDGITPGFPDKATVYIGDAEKVGDY